jgi:hypothetical protein
MAAGSTRGRRGQALAIGIGVFELGGQRAAFPAKTLSTSRAARRSSSVSGNTCVVGSAAEARVCATSSSPGGRRGPRARHRRTASPRSGNGRPFLDVVAASGSPPHSPARRRAGEARCRADERRAGPMNLGTHRLQPGNPRRTPLGARRGRRWDPVVAIPRAGRQRPLQRCRPHRCRLESPAGRTLMRGTARTRQSPSIRAVARCGAKCFIDTVSPGRTARGRTPCAATRRPAAAGSRPKSQGAALRPGFGAAEVPPCAASIGGGAHHRSSRRWRARRRGRDARDAIAVGGPVSAAAVAVIADRDGGATGCRHRAACPPRETPAQSGRRFRDRPRSRRRAVAPAALAGAGSRVPRCAGPARQWNADDFDSRARRASHAEVVAPSASITRFRAGRVRSPLPSPS